jgi:hypothetical protein
MSAAGLTSDLDAHVVLEAMRIWICCKCRATDSCGRTQAIDGVGLRQSGGVRNSNSCYTTLTVRLLIMPEVGNFEDGQKIF